MLRSMLETSPLSPSICLTSQHSVIYTSALIPSGMCVWVPQVMGWSGVGIVFMHAGT